MLNPPDGPSSPTSGHETPFGRELLGYDERLEVDPANVRFLFQGASDPEYRGNPYGKIPWRLGILEMVR